VFPKQTRQSDNLIWLFTILFLLVTTCSLATQKEHPDQFQSERLKMVDVHIESRGITDKKTLAAMKKVPRHRFVAEAYGKHAYINEPLPIGYGQTISQPSLVAYMTEIIEPQANSRILEIGTGSGYQSAILAQIVAEVFSIEIIPQLAQRTSSLLNELGYDNIRTKEGDGYYGWPQEAPYDAIIVTAAAPFIPPPLIEQLKPGGKMVIPVGSPFRVQHLMLVEKNATGDVTTKNLLPVRFVPLRRAQ